MRHIRGVIAILVLFLAALVIANQEQDEVVAFNTETRKYHCLKCSSARACTRNCVEIPLSEAKKRGGVPCKRCGGTCAFGDGP